MLYQAKNGSVPIDGTPMDYVRFGVGSRTLVMLPGLGDGLQTVKGLAIPMAWMYREFAKDFTVYMFSRKDTMAEGITTRDMARDLKIAMDALGISKADVIGVSMGGMIAQWLAIDYPQNIGKLILVVTSAEPNAILLDSVRMWIEQARRGDHRALMDSNMRRIYSETYCRKNGWMVPILGVVTKPKNYERFLIQAQACLDHNAADCLGNIHAPTLVLGGEKDLALGAEPSRAIARAIPNSQLRMYDRWGHGLYEEEPTYHKTVLTFLNGK